MVAPSELAPSVSIPDLLYAQPAARLDATKVTQGVAFAYAVGEGGDLLASALDEVSLGRSSFEPAHFAHELFLDDLVRSCFNITACGRRYTPNRVSLARILSHPPEDPASCAVRRDILLELAESPALRTDLERTYVELFTFRNLLCTSQQGGGSTPELHQHRIGVLRALKSALEGLGSRFASTKSELRRIHVFGTAVVRRKSFADLSALLAHEDGLADVDLSLRIGADGSVRGFELMKIREHESRYYKSPLSRFAARIVLFFRGYRFSELEVMARLLDEVFAPFEGDVLYLLQLMQDLELYLGALSFRDLALSRGLAVCIPEIVPPPSEQEHSPRDLRGLFNPLLLADRGVPKPCDLQSDRHDAIVVVTGPNSGGKTRLLQAIAIAQMLAQNGLFVPARHARIAWTRGLFVSLHHEITADQKEGRLGTELLRIRSLFEELRPGDLVVFDELCSGTNPSEAEAIIRLVLNLLHELNPQVFVTTHFLDFAAELESSPHTERLQFLQAALDERNRPTYTFLPGVAKSALAAETAARLGVTLEELASLVARRKAERNRRASLPESLGHAAEFAEEAAAK
ncbi:MAG: DNA mismatch repair protein [Polyangiaceae bacterium]|nr:DNA mismatch repair protein [Polyangiaceae bacterium]